MSGDGLAEEVLKAAELVRADDTNRKDVWYYLFILAVIVAMLCAMMLLNAYVHFVDESSYHVDPGTASAYQLAGYVGMFLTIALLPIPDYFLIPIYGYLCALGIFDPFITFFVCLAGAILPFAYIPARYAGRPLLLKGVSYFGISNKRIEASEKWLRENGRSAVFISTFVPFLYLPVSLAAGLLKMGWVEFLGISALGFGIRFAFLEIVGYSGSLIFTSTFDYDHRYLIAVVMLLASAYVAAYVLGLFRPKKANA